MEKFYLFLESPFRRGTSRLVVVVVVVGCVVVGDFIDLL